MKRMVIAVDGSPTSRLVVSRALALAKSLGSAVTLVSVIKETPPTFEGAVDHPTEAAMSTLNRAIAEAARSGVEAEYQILTGDAVEQISQFGHDRDADMIVVGSRGLGSITGALLGSVSHGVLTHADRTVLVVKGQPED